MYNIPENIKKNIANSMEWRELELWINTEIYKYTEKTINTKGIEITDVIRFQEKISTLKQLRDMINKCKTKEE